jgi:AmmeMemoRadiSam system protein B
MYKGQPVVVLQDPLQLSGQSFIIQQPVAAALAFFDGRHSLKEIEMGVESLAGIELDKTILEELVARLDDCLLLESDRFDQAHSDALEKYRQAEFRPSILSGRSYPDSRDELRAWLDSFEPEPELSEAINPTGLISPHLDYERGGQIYANVFHAARRSIIAADLIVIFGTDHHSPSTKPILTGKDFATPLGLAPTAHTLVDQLVDATSVDLIEHELYHTGEHSIELALIWAQHILDGRPAEFLPILAGSVNQFLEGEVDTPDEDHDRDFVKIFQEAVGGQKVILIASADLAHIGPAFGGLPVDEEESDRLLGSDMEKIDRLCHADGIGFLELIRRDHNFDSICGSAPIFRLLTWERYNKGHLVGYAQCDADSDGTSVVSACGMVFEK